jgi:hypothetical protein
MGHYNPPVGGVLKLYLSWFYTKGFTLNILVVRLTVSNNLTTSQK